MPLLPWSVTNKNAINFPDHEKSFIFLWINFRSCNFTFFLFLVQTRTKSPDLIFSSVIQVEYQKCFADFFVPAIAVCNHIHTDLWYGSWAETFFWHLCKSCIVWKLIIKVLIANKNREWERERNGFHSTYCFVLSLLILQTFPSWHIVRTFYVLAFVPYRWVYYIWYELVNEVITVHRWTKTFESFATDFYRILLSGIMHLISIVNMLSILFFSCTE